MFEFIVFRITTTVRNIVRAVGTTTSCSSWLAPAAILALFLLV
jgi:hypothetical protein